MPPKLGILAGGGRLPLDIVDACRDNERPFFVIALAEQADTKDYTGIPHAQLRLGAAGAAIKRLREEGCEQLVLAGSVKRPGLAELRPDFWTARFFARSGASALGDNGLLTALVRALENEGFSVVGADDLLPHALATAGIFGAKRPGPEDFRDIDIAVAAALDLGRRDIGQAAVARDGMILALEEADGTDAMLARLTPCANASGVIVKVRKPGQERRADLPTIGIATVDGAHQAGLAGIAVDAGGALVMQRDEMIARADALGLFIVGIAVDASSAGIQ